MKKLYWIFFVFFSIVSCSHDGSIDDRLDTAEAMIPSSPDSALTYLLEIDGHFTKEQNARHALLISIALDKNYIDQTSDSLINIAVNYYQHKSRTLEKFKAYYYQARVYQNSGKMDKAMESIVKAEHVKAKQIDAADIARMYIVKSQICSCRFAINDELKYLKSAAYYADQAGNKNNLVYVTLRQANIYLLKENKHSLDSCFRIVRSVPEISYYNNLSLLELELQSALKDNVPTDSLRRELTQYMNISGDISELAWKTIAQVYLHMNEPDSAVWALTRHREFADVRSDEPYFLLMANAYAAADDYRQAYKSLQRYSDLSDSLDLVSIRQEVSSVEEMYLNRMKLRRQRLNLIALILIIVLIGVVSVLYLRKRRITDNENREKYAELKLEYDGLLELKKKHDETLSQRNKSPLFGGLSAGILDSRIKALGVFLSENKPESLHRVSDQLDELGKNRDNVVDSIGLLYAMNHPAFVTALSERGLTSSEIGFCCLLLLGFNVADAGSIVNNYSTYNLSSKIRKKLGFESGKGKLSTWVKDLYNSTETSVTQ